MAIVFNVCKTPRIRILQEVRRRLQCHWGKTALEAYLACGGKNDTSNL